MLGEAHTKLGHYEEAERWYKAALEAEPDHVPAHLKYGRMLAKNVSESWKPLCQLNSYTI